MMLKRAYFAGTQNGEPLLHILKPGDRIKTAGVMMPETQRFVDQLSPDPSHTYVLVNAMGNSWFYGPNANRDWYGYNPHLEFDGLLHAWDGIGDDVELDRMKGKDWPYGYPSFYNAAVYAHHKNTDPQLLGFGDILFAAHNPEMKRIELVERVFNDEAAKKGHTSILDRIAAGERVDVSMGAKVPFDLCSICTDWGAIRDAWRSFDPKQHRHPGIAILARHKTKPIRGLAVTQPDYCECMTKTPGRILADGRKVFVFNDFPRFFDISFVLVGADRTARVMWHMGGSRPKPQPVVSMATRLLDALLSRPGLLKAASMEKEIPDGVAEAVHRDTTTAPDFSTTLEIVLNGQDSGTVGARRLLTVMAALGIVPTPREFQTIALTTVPGGSLIRRALNERNVVFDVHAGGISDDLAVDPKLYSPKLASVLRPMMEERSSFAPFLYPRLDAYSDVKEASAEPITIRTALLNKLSAQYNGYRLSALEHCGDLYPKAAGFLGPDALLDQPGRGIGVAALLLGLGPVLQLLSSHLARSSGDAAQLKDMAPFVSTNPSFESIQTIGAALRVAMTTGDGGLADAARSVTTAARGVL